MIIGYPVKLIYKKNEFFTLYFEDSDTLYK